MTGTSIRIVQRQGREIPDWKSPPLDPGENPPWAGTGKAAGRVWRPLQPR